MDNVSAIILAGGQSRRMGENKALLSINKKTVIETIYEKLQLKFQDIKVVANEPEVYSFLNIEVVTDIYWNQGPLAGIHAGVKASKYEETFVIACDMPFISIEMIDKVLNNKENYEAVVPKINGKIHPLFAMYNNITLSNMENCLKQKQLKMKTFLQKIQVKYITEMDLTDISEDTINSTFFNMNKPSEYYEAKQMFK